MFIGIIIQENFYQHTEERKNIKGRVIKIK